MEPDAVVLELDRHRAEEFYDHAWYQHNKLHTYALMTLCTLASLALLYFTLFTVVGRYLGAAYITMFAVYAAYMMLYKGAEFNVEVNWEPQCHVNGRKLSLDGEFLSILREIQRLDESGHAPHVILGDLRATGWESQNFNIVQQQMSERDLVSFLDARVVKSDEFNVKLDEFNVKNGHGDVHWAIAFEKRNDALATSALGAVELKRTSKPIPKVLVVVGAAHVEGVANRLMNIPNPVHYPTGMTYPFSHVDQQAGTVTLF